MSDGIRSICDLLADFDWAASTVDMGADTTVIVRANIRRVYLLISDMGGAGDIWAAPVRQPALGQGFNVGTLATGALEFWFPRHGPIPTLEWVGNSVGGLGTVYVLEVFYRT